MNLELQTKIQAFLDGELSAAEQREIAALLARDADAAALHAELKNTRGALKNFDRAIQLPESREFYWAKIQREIQRASQPAEERPKHNLFSFWRRAVALGGGFAVFAVTLLILNLPQKKQAGLEVAMTESNPFTFRNDESGTTLVWLSFPAENDVAAGSAPTTIQ